MKSSFHQKYLGKILPFCITFTLMSTATLSAPTQTRQEIIDFLNFHNMQSPYHAYQAKICLVSLDWLFQERKVSDRHIVFNDVQINHPSLDPKRGVAPDIAVLKDAAQLGIEQNNSYNLLAYGIIPSVAIEIANSRENEQELS